MFSTWDFTCLFSNRWPKSRCWVNPCSQANSELNSSRLVVHLHELVVLSCLVELSYCLVEFLPFKVSSKFAQFGLRLMYKSYHDLTVSKFLNRKLPIVNIQDTQRSITDYSINRAKCYKQYSNETFFANFISMWYFGILPDTLYMHRSNFPGELG